MRQNIGKHIKHIYEEGELDVNRTCNKKLQVQTEGKRQVKREVAYYTLKMIIVIGYRVKSSVATSFRKWANDVIEEFMKKGFVLDDKRLEDPSKFGHDYFDELLSRIKDNPNYKWVEFDPLLNESGKNSFIMTPTKWISKTNAISIKTMLNCK